MNLKNVIGLSLAAAAGLLAVGCASAPPKILVGHYYLGVEKSSKIVILDSGVAEKGKKLFHVYVRNCNINPDATETGCKDTLILENVDPASIY
jgi:hypothetical protein